MIRDNLVVLTGAMGAGKSTILGQLRTRGLRCIDEPARQILAEQRSVGGTGVPEHDASLFNQLMLSRALQLFGANADVDGLVVFDRGIPDLIAYAELFGLEDEVYRRAAEVYRYNKTVLWFGGWGEIYTTDDERKMGFEAAEEFGNRVFEIYGDLGYTLLEVPRVSIQERVDFILAGLARVKAREP